MGKVLSVNVGGVREFEYNGRLAKSAIWKTPFPGRVAAWNQGGLALAPTFAAAFLVYRLGEGDNPSDAEATSS